MTVTSMPDDVFDAWCDIADEWETGIAEWGWCSLQREGRDERISIIAESRWGYLKGWTPSRLWDTSTPSQALPQHLILRPKENQ